MGRAMKKDKRVSIEKIHKTEKKIEQKIRKKSNTFWSEFKKFITKGNIVDLAIAMVMGTAFNAIVKGLVEFIITPVTTYLIGSTVDLSEMKYVIREAVAATETTEEVAEVAIMYGSFIQTIINFLIIALSIFVTLRIYLRAMKVMSRREEAKKKAEEAKKKAEEEKKKAEEAAIAAEKAEAERKKAEEDAAVREQFYRDAAEQAQTLREIRDLLKQKNS